METINFSERQKLLKILMIAPTPFFADRGCHVKILEELKSLTKRGIKVVLVTYHIGRDIAGFEIERMINIPWYKKLDAGPSFHKYYLDILLCFKALGAAVRLKPDIIHAHLHEGVFVGRFVQFFIRKPLVADYQGSMTGEMLDHGFVKKESLSFKFNRWLENMVNKWPQIIIFSSIQAKDYFIKNFPVNPQKVVSFVEGTNTDDFHPGYNTADIRAKLNLPEDRKIVIYLGVLSKYQGIDLLIRSVPEVIKRYKNVHFLIVGFPDIEYYSNMAEEFGVNKYITFTGKIPHEDAPKYLNLGDIGVSLKLSKTEANGKLFGYMAVGLPCIAFDTDTNREIMGETGIYAEYGNTDSFIEKLVYLLENENIAKTIGQLSRQRVLEKFTWDNTFSNFIPIYYDLISRNEKYGRNEKHS
ncbi:MAG: glycosyltransferase family 4 protein [Actinobacteria bacterium]|nr:glycosyltransferase family 4 protein [Actinomycetota bacterium]